MIYTVFTPYAHRTPYSHLIYTVFTPYSHRVPPVSHPPCFKIKPRRVLYSHLQIEQEPDEEKAETALRRKRDGGVQLEEAEGGHPQRTQRRA